MLILHISDIHFRHPVCNSSIDPDRPYRTHLLRDARERAKKLGPVGAILVTGDIAFQGAAAEYDAAFTWLRELANACGCPLERVFVVPGNHDVDRSVIRSNASVRNVQHAIANTQPHRRERELFEQFQDASAGRALLAPLAAYNDFAARFNCQVYPPDHLFWHQDLPLDGRTVLRLYGLTSTLLSGIGGKDDTRLSLYLSPLQTVLDPADGVVNVVMSHHPPDWFMDQDEVDDAIRGRAAIHLFGHKHRQRCFRDESYVRFSAGAVNPERQEPGWEPGYNLIQVLTGEAGGQRYIDVEAHLLAWQTNPDMFRPKMVSQTEAIFRHRLPVHGDFAHTPPPISSIGSAASTEAVMLTATAEPRAVDMETAMSDERTRNLVLRFWSLASSQRREIAIRLGLIDQEELRLPEPERYGRALLRARERLLLDRVAEEIERMEKH
ncbi:metallophosphoesterase [Archangium minus]|uniref:Metallophosphoesterase n=1 Tax=Archangium minus TaxID=83450 RepID=A0ABY9X513_9BACT|nr:metallophosphoesterase [Archangium minus]